jgi:hypothetical protein
MPGIGIIANARAAAQPIHLVADSIACAAPGRYGHRVHNNRGGMC